MSQVKINHLLSEQRNPNTMNLDDMSVEEFLTVMNKEDQSVALSVEKVLPQVAEAVKHIVEGLKKGGHLYYVGSGTSGRLGVLDAVECPPTFGTTDEVVGIIAGGDSAFVKAKEGAEDSLEGGMKDIEERNITENDTVVGIAASGRTPHTIGALTRAKELGAFTVALACNPGSEIGKVAEIAIEVATGPEVISGSTRLKAGTAQKMVLNMLSTASMIGIGKTYQNLMVDMKSTNAKLKERSLRILMEATGCDYETAKEYVVKSEGHIKTAIVMILCNCTLEEAKERLDNSKGFVKKATL